MHTEWTELVRDGGISAPAWAFFTAIATGIGILIKLALTIRADSKKAVTNTTNVSNGFVKRQDDNFTTLFEMVSRIDRKFDRLDEKVDGVISANGLKEK